MSRRIKIDLERWPEIAHLCGALRGARDAAGLSLDAVAKQMGTTADYIRGMEEGYANPSIQLLCAYARILKVPISALLPTDVVPLADTATPGRTPAPGSGPLRGRPKLTVIPGRLE